MELFKGTILLLTVLSVFTIFSLKAPKGMKAMGALADAAVASFLVEAFQSYVGGDMLNIPLLKETGIAAGGMGGAAAGALVPIALGVSPVYGVLIGCACAGLGILPGFVAGYIMAFIIKKIENKIPKGLDLVICVAFCAPIARFIGNLATPVVNATLINIGGIITNASTQNPTVMGFILGGVITVVATAPLSSMALTAMLGLQGVPMAIGALSVMGSSFMNLVFFHKMKFGDRSTTIAVAIEPLTQADVVSANPIPVYLTNFIGGGISGIIIASFGLINNASGTATPIAGLMVMYGFNDPLKVTLVAVLCAVSSAAVGFFGAIVFKNYKIRTVDEIRNGNLRKELIA
ncbi:PTS sugar transporter subunit IIC [Clostridium fallax]|uniref:Phosphotransferase system, fructose-specific IIC component n=1 Tax=Clostridium fallax TaxID=1533 RepID=A0A1M4XV62_9CLOT|nr:PTS sugar transporter subunit IIC [Clostridium fallax]SHE97308.1 Phosphotransferase system, fructose-specific IIC component [Clostridium fallax]SQB06522.1 transcriptional regulator [Clostridium fallax]